MVTVLFQSNQPKINYFSCQITIETNLYIYISKTIQLIFTSSSHLSSMICVLHHPNPFFLHFILQLLILFNSSSCILNAYIDSPSYSSHFDFADFYDIVFNSKFGTYTGLAMIPGQLFLLMIFYSRI